MIHKNSLSLLLFACGLIVLCSCGKREYESNDVLLKKAITAAATAKNGGWPKARELAYKAVTQNGNDANARVMLALALEQCEQEEQALEEIKQAVNIDSENFMAQYTMGRMLFKNKRYQDCPAPLEKANELKPGVPQTILLLARTNAILGVHEKAITHYVALAKLDEYKNTPEPYNELGVLFMGKKDYKRALSFFREAYAKDNNNISVNINLAVFWDLLTQMCEDDKKKVKKTSASAIKYYMAAEKLLRVNPQAEPKRRKILKRIKELKRVQNSTI